MTRSVHKERQRTERIGWLRAAVLGSNDGILPTASSIVEIWNFAIHAVPKPVSKMSPKRGEIRSTGVDARDTPDVDVINYRDSSALLQKSRATMNLEKPLNRFRSP